ncbi:hypothetical protein [Alkalicoccobacillus murimartini]|uniref:Lipoprotein n=1 Tax=Alkalicoccobacillus murimartini TaxID=171685 RepID=A0ABT9YCS3_9BACI|nr:hypothetical protein [Alkalicoccobacillus murimartini]MDQ0205654.1 hypothetical protein [Alkalicoccobacillus murimartini]
MKLFNYIYLVAFVFILAGCSEDASLTLKDAELTGNEEILFSAIAKETYLFDLEGTIPQGTEMTVGVDYYEFGELSEENQLFGVSRAIDEESEYTDDYQKLFIMMEEQEYSSNVMLDVILNTENGSYSTYGSELEGINLQDRAYSSGSIFLEEEDLDEIILTNETINEKQYIARYIISADNSFRSFDLEHATQPNQDYEFLYLFYVQLQDIDEN